MNQVLTWTDLAPASAQVFLLAAACAVLLIDLALGDRQRWIIDQLVDRLRVGGLLVLGAGEDACWLAQNVRRLQWPGVCAYQKTGG